MGRRDAHIRIHTTDDDAILELDLVSAETKFDCHLAIFQAYNSQVDI